MLLAVALLLVLVAFWTEPAAAYTLLTHEQLIDLTWDDSIVPLLLSRYPSLTPAQIEHARSFAYGGCVIQDIGYYPFGDRFFSNLTHYVRTGDFVIALFRNARNADELAFAIGALSHYVGDTYGHSLATNLAVPVEFPRLRHEYGPVVSFGEGETQHVRTEFAFDINELDHQRMAPVRYQKHVGLRIPIRQLALAYYQTYGLTRGFSRRGEQHINLGGYRFAVRAFIPHIAQAIAILHSPVEPADPNTPEIRQLRKEVTAVAAENRWARYRRRPGIGIYSLAALIYILPKIGPLRLSAVKGPTQNTELDYLHSVTVSTRALRRILIRFTPLPATQQRPAAPRNPRNTSHLLENRDLDTGYVVQPGGYALTDETYAKLLHLLTQADHPIPPGIKRDIEAYYADLRLPITTKRSPKRWKQVLSDLAELENMPTSPEPQPYPTYGEDLDQ